MKKIVVLSGAGISAESGIQTFRDSDGLWENYAIEEVATPEAWKRNPSLVQTFYNERRKRVIEALPNEAHYYFKKLESTYDVQIITQNIDDLHERAGNSKVLHLHGNIRFAKSSGPNPDKKFYPIEGNEIPEGAICDDGFPLRPHVVWFGEAVPELERAAAICRDADILIVIGTSLQVYPAASLAFLAPESAVKVVIDPQCEQLKMEDDFIKLPYTAVEGVKVLDRILAGLEQH